MGYPCRCPWIEARRAVSMWGVAMAGGRCRFRVCRADGGFLAALG